MSELQHAHWRKDPDNAGKIYDQGLFEYSMHINYFGDVVWSTGMALIGTLLAAGGVFGFTARTVSQRKRELAIRLALGANDGEVTGEVVRSSMRAGLVGLTLGLVGSLALSFLDLKRFSSSS